MTNGLRARAQSGDITLIERDVSPAACRCLLLLEQEHTSTKNDILPVFIGESGVGAGILRHSCRTLQGETGKETGNKPQPVTVR